VRVLLIDDHALFRSGLQELLQRRGIQVVAAVGSGEEGCRLARDRQPDVVLLDMRMPGMTASSSSRSYGASGSRTPSSC